MIADMICNSTWNSLCTMPWTIVSIPPRRPPSQVWIHARHALKWTVPQKYLPSTNLTGNSIDSHSVWALINSFQSDIFHASYSSNHCALYLYDERNSRCGAMSSCVLWELSPDWKQTPQNCLNQLQNKKQKRMCIYNILCIYYINICKHHIYFFHMPIATFVPT